MSKNNFITISNIKIINVQNALIFHDASTAFIDNVIFEDYTEYAISILNSETKDEFIIVNSVFIGSSNSNTIQAIEALNVHLVIKNSQFINNVGPRANSLSFSGQKLHLENNLFQDNITTGHSSTVSISNLNPFDDKHFIKIVNNQFINNQIEVDAFPTISANLTVGSVHSFGEVHISNNIFKQDFSEHSNFRNVSITSSASNDIIVEYLNNTEIGFGRNSQPSLYLSVWDTPVNIKNSIFTGRIQASSSPNTTISNSWFFDIENPDTEVNLNTMITGIPSNNRHDLFIGNPHLDMETLRPIWNSQFKSGLINNGHRDTNGDGIFWWNDPEDSDPDNTRLDIGAVHYQHGIIKHWIFPPLLASKEKDFTIQPRSVESIEWLAFPYLDKMYDPANFPHAQAGYVFGPHNDNNLFGQNEQNEDFLESISWNFNNDQGVISR
ncbi:MAG: hypothetical protein FWG98_15045, partial [Candidatus Cloacimonetes bacterium]|nr:hypothetical protein [Candidatus Cloacimonadota bacterium]